MSTLLLVDGVPRLADAHDTSIAKQGSGDLDKVEYQ